MNIMLDIQQKRKVRGIMYHRITLGVLSVVVMWFLHSTWSVWQKKRESEKMRNVSLEQVEGLRARNIELDSKIQRIETTPGVEEEIRSKFSVVKDNEKMVIIVESEDSKASTTSQKGGFWDTILGFFGY
jgi:cell division protein FtsB